MLVDRVCKVCGQPFQMQECWIAKQKNGGSYCSVECRNIGAALANVKQNRNALLYCAVCGQEFKVKPYRAESAKCCSNECRAKYVGQLNSKDIVQRQDWDNSHQRRTWHDAILERDDGTCQHCGSLDKLEAHHYFSVTDYPIWAGDLWNGITLCQTCHKEIHRQEVLV